MDENDNDSVKVTIRVKISDDDYQDIHFDWSKIHTYDGDKSIFEQLSAFTGIQVEAVRNMVLLTPGPRGDWQWVTRIANPCLNKPLFPRYYEYDRVHERAPMRDAIDLVHLRNSTLI